MFKVIFIDVDEYNIIYTVKGNIEVSVKKSEIDKKLNIKKGNYITFDTLFLQNLNKFHGLIVLFQKKKSHRASHKAMAYKCVAYKCVAYKCIWHHI